MKAANKKSTYRKISHSIAPKIHGKIFISSIIMHRYQFRYHIVIKMLLYMILISDFENKVAK